MDEGLWTMVAAAGAMEKGILILLGVCSIILWSMVFLKIPEFRAAKRNAQLFMNEFQDTDNFAKIEQLDSPATDCVQFHIFKAAMKALSTRSDGGPARGDDPGSFKVNPEKSTEEIVLLSMQHTSSDYFGRMQRGLSSMATIGSTTPFIGLFGTVVGIMTTFQDLGTTKTPSMQVVAPGISGALVATAAGLAVAIPAVIWCNWFLAEIDEIREGANVFIEKMMSIIRANQANTEKAHVGLATSKPAAAPAKAPLKPAVIKPGAPKAVKKDSELDEDDDDADSDDDDSDLPVTATKGSTKRGLDS